MLALWAAILICVRIVIDRAEPILRARVIETLSTRFHSPVELDEIHVWIAHGLHVQGKGLKIFGVTDPNPSQAGVQPLVAVSQFSFQTALGNLFREPMRVDTIFVDGLTMNIPPPGPQRTEIRNLRRRGKISIAVDQFACTNTILLINSARPEKPPLEFHISDIRLKDIGPGKPFHFDAKLVNPRPVGDIHSIGLFGPINERSPPPPPPPESILGEESESLQQSLFRGDQTVLSDQDIARILATKVDVSDRHRLAVLSLSPTSYWSQDLADVESKNIDSLLQTLKSSPQLTEARAMPSLLVPEKRTVPYLREAAARVQADLLFIYSARIQSFRRDRFLKSDEVRAQCIAESVLLDVRTGIVLHTGHAAENISMKKTPGTSISMKL